MLHRELLAPTALLTAGLLLGGGLAIARFTPFFDPAPKADVEHLIHQALGDPDPALPHGDSLLSIEGVGLTTGAGDSGPGPPQLASALHGQPWVHPTTPAPAQPAAWAAAAARRNPDALRGWLDWAVLPVATTDGDTVRFRMYRLTLRPECPLLDRIEATLSRTGGGWDTRLVRVEGGCWE